MAIIARAVLFSAAHVTTGEMRQGFVTLIAGLCSASVLAAHVRGGFEGAFGLTALAPATNKALALLLAFGFGYLRVH